MFATTLSVLGVVFSTGVLGWIFQLGNRVTKLETKLEDIPDILEIQFESVRQRLDRIERSLNGHLIKD